MSDKLEILKTLNSVAVVTSPLAVGALVVGGTGGVISAIIGATTGVAWGTVITAVAAPLLGFHAEVIRRQSNATSERLKDLKTDLHEVKGQIEAVKSTVVDNREAMHNVMALHAERLARVEATISRD